MPDHAKLTVSEAAERLPSDCQKKAIPYRASGPCLRIRVDDVLTYKARDDRERDTIMDEAVRGAQKQEMGSGLPA